jgi:serine/threonine protein kinase/Tfp pilus assembly protein PilF
MQPAVPAISTCPTCGGALEETSGGGLGCMICLLRAGIGSEEEVSQDSTREALERSGHFGVYEIDRREDGSLYELGRGAMGVTYRATDTTLRRKVALKIIKIDVVKRSVESRERFMREARAAAALRHENIATVYQFGIREETGQYFYAMELIEGETLDQRVHRAGPLDARTTIQIGQQVTSALAAAEKHGLIHRDLKPANLMLVSSDGETAGADRVAPSTPTQRRGRKTTLFAVAASLRPGAHRNPEKLLVKIIDFGLAKALHTETDPQSLTHERFVGTPAFASPEQFEHSTLDVRSDIYSLGETLWFALTGKTPFAGRSVEQIHRAQQSHRRPTEQLKAAHVPSRLRSLLESMLALEPASRPGTHELAARLQRCSPEARQLRHKRVALATAALLILGVSASFILLSLHTQNSVSNLGAPDKSIAVLPFRNLSSDTENAYLAEGIQDEILTRLSKIADLRVISRTSTQQYQSKPRNLGEIAKQVGVANILEGTVQKVADQIRVNVQLINAQTDSHLWADTYDRKLTDILVVESEVAKAIADQLQAKLTGAEAESIAAKPTDNPEAYDAYLRGLAYTLKTEDTAAKYQGAQRYLKEAVRLDPKFALAWALLSYTDADAYVTRNLQPTDTLREEARQAAETALSLQPNLGEALMAKGYYHYACLKDYDSATRYLEQARQLLPNNNQIPESLAYVARRRGQWDRSEAYFKEAERLNVRDANLLIQHALSYICVRRFPEALRKLDEVLNITPDDVSILAIKARIAQAEGDLPRAAALLTPARSTADDSSTLGERIEQAILERKPAQIIPQVKAELAKLDPASDFHAGQLRFWLGWLQELAGDHAAAHATWQQARSELEPFLKAQPENRRLLDVLALTNMGLGDKAAAFGLLDRALAAMPIEKDALDGAAVIETVAQVAARMGEPDRAISALRIAISIPSPSLPPFTPAVLRLDPMFDALRGDPRFQELCRDK